MSKDNVFTYEPKMKANWELIAEIMRCDCQEIIYKDKQVADLEAKLAELNKEPLNCSQLETGMSLCIIQKSEIAQLKQQLAEKDKEIEDLKAQRRIYLNRSVDECNKITDLEFELQHKDQDKISFALDQLEKVKELLYPELCFDYSLYLRVMHEIENQIAELKKEMK